MTDLGENIEIISELNVIETNCFSAENGVYMIELGIKMY